MMDTAEQTQCTYPTSKISHCGNSNEIFSTQKLQPTSQSSWDTSKPSESQDSWNSSQSLQQTPQLRDIFSSPIPTYSSPSHGRWSDLNQNGDNHNSVHNSNVNEIHNNVLNGVHNSVHNNIVQNNISNNVQENAVNFFAEEAARMWEASQLQSQFNQMSHPFFYNPSDDNFIPRMDVMMAPNQWDLGLTQNDSNYYPLVDPISDNSMKFEMGHQFDNHFNSNPFDFPQLIPRFPNHDANLLSLEASLPNPFPSMDQTNQRRSRKIKSVSSVTSGTSAATGTSPPSDSKSKPSSSYRCDFEGCGKTFTRPYNLKAHARIHTQERPFSCLVCHYAFSRLHDMKRHMNLHSGLKPFQCPHCTKSFARLDALNRHVKKDAGTCSTVSRTKFSRTQTL